MELCHSEICAGRCVGSIFLFYFSSARYVDFLLVLSFDLYMNFYKISNKPKLYSYCC